MAMWKVAVLGAAIGATLSGCGESDEPTASPGYRPANLAAAWKNHLDAFGAKDVAKIKLDYNEQSIIRVFNDFNDDANTLEEYTGVAAIGGMFTQLFQDIGSAAVDVKADKLRDEEFKTEFLVWNAPLAGFNRATDTFLFGNDFKIKVQNIVISKPTSAAAAALPAPKANATARRLATPSEALANYQALVVQGNSKRTDLVVLYKASSNTVVQHYEWSTNTHEVYAGHVQISGFYESVMFAGLTLNSVLQTVSKVDAAAGSSFFLWKADEFESVANTFVYDDDGLIRTHTVVTKKVNRVAEASKEGQTAMMV